MRGRQSSAHSLLTRAAGSPLERLDRAEEYLRAGYFADGWALYEARRELPGFPGNNLPTGAPPWDGVEPIRGHRILLWHEQGLGDMIQMLRFAPAVARRGASVIVAIQSELKRLASSVAGVAAVITADDACEEVDYQCPLLSLPYLLRIRLAMLPASVPYLSVPGATMNGWRDRLGPRRGLRVGMAYHGNPANKGDTFRSIPAVELRELFEVPDVEFHLLHDRLDPGDERYLSSLPNLHLHCAALQDLAETAALARNMDLIITVCTSIAHLAGALALPTWLLLSTHSYCLWMSDRSDSPWYPTIRLFRQSAPGAWGPVVARTAARLRASRSGHAVQS
jgi:hypothetical protein